MTRTNARKRLNKERIRDSPRNCLMSCKRKAPRTFLTPTSLALLADRAVERFMKLKEAMSRMKNAIAEKT